MSRPSLKELAQHDRQIARFIERAELKAAAKAERERLKEDANKKRYRTNHLPETRDLGSLAIEAINRCILP